MSEPSVISKTEKITYRSIVPQVGKPQVESAVVRKNRTAQETSDQFNRVMKQIKKGSMYGQMERIMKLSDVYRRTARALDAAGRGNSITPMATMVNRRNR